MTLEFIKTVALLCQLAIAQSGGSSRNTENTEYDQLQCQQYFMKCVDTKAMMKYKTEASKLQQCILDKKLP